jgi:hypothetical protein
MGADVMRGAVIAVAALAAATGATAQERLIAQTPQMVAVTEGVAHCGDPVPITIRASDAGFFADRLALQRAVDGVRAILTFECARIPALDIAGLVSGSSEPAWTGYVGDATGWLVEPAAGGAAALDTPANRFPVAQVDVGMTPAEAIEALTADFGARPAFDAAAGRIEAAEGPAGPADEAFPPLGARRLVGLFSEGAAPRLAAATLRQTVDGDQTADIAAALTDRYGEPAGRATDAGELVLGWGRTLDADPARRELEARIEAREGATVLTLTREDPSASAAPRLRARF